MATQPECFGSFDVDDEECRACQKPTRVSCEEVTKLRNEAIDLSSEGKLQEWFSKIRDDPLLLNAVGNGLLFDEKYDIAKEIFEYYAGKKPEDANSHFGLGRSLMRLGQFEKAIKEFELITTRLEPGNADAFRLLGMCYFFLKDKKRTYEAFMNAVKLDFEQVYEIERSLLQLEAIDDVILLLKKGLEMRPKNADLYNDLGAIYLDNDKNEDALDKLKKAVEINPNHVLAHYNLGRVYQEMNDLDKATSELKKTIELDPSHADSYYELGNVYENKRMIIEALKAFRMHLKLTKPWQYRVQIEEELKESLRNVKDFSKDDLEKVTRMINDMNGTINRANIKIILDNFDVVKNGIITFWKRDAIPDDLIIRTFEDLKGTAAVPALLSNILFLKNREKYNICVPATMRGLENLGRFVRESGVSIGENYINFNASANRFRQEEELHPETVDWLLWKVYKLSKTSKITPEIWTKTTPKIGGAHVGMSGIEKVVMTHLIAGRNLVLYGPPGTGKTRKVVKIAKEICGKENFTFETGNAEWTAYDIVGGPTISGKTKLRFRPGILTLAAQKCSQALDETGRPHWLIIDELNRANLDLAFGKVFSLLDIEYRDQPIIDESELEGLENSDVYKDLRIPAQFRILATMNTYDRAILFSLGYAFRRRFAFVEIGSPFVEETKKVYELNEENWRKETANVGGGVLEEIEEEIDKWINSAFLLPEKMKETSIEQVDSGLPTLLRTLDGEVKAGELDPFHPYKFAYKLADYLTRSGIVEVGYAQPVDLVKYALTYVALFSDGQKKHAMIRALDEGVKAYFMPQIEYYLPQARRKMTLGEREEAEEAEKKLQDLRSLLARLGLLESARKMEEVSSRLKTGEIRIL